MHIVGAIVGEHTYNVDAYDRLQTYYVKAISYLSSKLTFAYDGEDITDFVQRPQFQKCAGKSDSYDLWDLPRAGLEPVVPRQDRRRRRAFPTTASAPPSSSPSMPARPSASASSIR